jgi:hypothetical protein
MGTCDGVQDVNQLAYEAAMCQATQRFVTKKTRGELSISVLQPADNFLDIVILPFLSILLGTELVCLSLMDAWLVWASEGSGTSESRQEGIELDLSMPAWRVFSNHSLL